VLKDNAMSRVEGLIDCCSPGEDLPAPHNDIDISSIRLQMRPVISAAIRSPAKTPPAHSRSSPDQCRAPIPAAWRSVIHSAA